MYKKYLDFVNESKGISNVNKIYTEDIFNLFDNIDKNINISLNNDILSLVNLNIIISYGNNEYYSIFDPKDFSLNNNILYDLKLIFKIPKLYDDTKLRQLITHELNHIIEFDNLVKNNREIPKHGQIKINIQDFRKFNYDNYFEAFVHYIYLTLDNEFNSRVAETYQYLKSFNTNDKSELIEHLYNSEIWLKIKEIELFDSERFGSFLINKIGLDATIIFLNAFNKSINKKYNITDYNDIIKYFNDWNNKFKYKLKKHKNKLLKIIDEVIKDHGISTF